MDNSDDILSFNIGNNTIEWEGEEIISSNCDLDPHDYLEVRLIFLIFTRLINLICW